MKILTDEQAAVLVAFLRSFEDRTTGAWALIEAGMREDFAIDDPESALQDAVEALGD